MAKAKSNEIVLSRDNPGDIMSTNEASSNSLITVVGCPLSFETEARSVFFKPPIIATSGQRYCECEFEIDPDWKLEIFKDDHSLDHSSGLGLDNLFM